MDLNGARVLVVGASSGIGRAVGAAALTGGARVAFAARRLDPLRDAAGQDRGRAIAIECDVTEPADCERLVRETVTEWDGLDALVYAAAYVSTGLLVDADAANWQLTLATNVVGAALVTRAAVPALIESHGRALYISSDTVLQPRPGLYPYAASKAALGMLVAGWRAEVPDVSFSRVVLGATAETDLARNTDPGVLRSFAAMWAELGFPHQGWMRPVDVAAEVLHILESALDVDDVVIEPRGPR